MCMCEKRRINNRNEDTKIRGKEIFPIGEKERNFFSLSIYSRVLNGRAFFFDFIEIVLYIYIHVDKVRGK